jgi:hypothetical protein
MLITIFGIFINNQVLTINYTLILVYFETIV